MLLRGMILAGMGVGCYVVHTMLLNYYLRKHAPERRVPAPRSSAQRKQRHGVTYLVVDTSTGVLPLWVALLGLPAIPLFLLGVFLMVVAFMVRLLS